MRIRLWRELKNEYIGSDRYGCLGCDADSNLVNIGELKND